MQQCAQIKMEISTTVKSVILKVALYIVKQIHQGNWCWHCNTAESTCQSSKLDWYRNV